MAFKIIFIFCACVVLVFGAVIEPRAKRYASQPNSGFASGMQNKLSTPENQNGMSMMPSFGDMQSPDMNNIQPSSGFTSGIPNIPGSSELQNGMSKMQGFGDIANLANNFQPSSGFASGIPNIPGTSELQNGMSKMQGFGDMANLANNFQGIGGKLQDAFNRTYQEEKNSVSDSFNSVKDQIHQNIETGANLTKTAFDLGTIFPKFGKNIIIN